VAVLESGLVEIHEMTSKIHESSFEAVRQRCVRYFEQLVPGKRVDLVKVDESSLESKGFRFEVEYIGLDNESRGEKVGTVRGRRGGRDSVICRGVSELSGGQKALLSLAFVFALAVHRPSPLYLLDEVDAALDETNQQAVAKVIASIFKDSQVICISHHRDFQTSAMHSIVLQMKNSETVLVQQT